MQQTLDQNASPHVLGGFPPALANHSRNRSRPKPFPACTGGVQMGFRSRGKRFSPCTGGLQTLDQNVSPSPGEIQFFRSENQKGIIRAARPTRRISSRIPCIGIENTSPSPVYSEHDSSRHRTRGVILQRDRTRWYRKGLPNPRTNRDATKRAAPFHDVQRILLALPRA